MGGFSVRRFVADFRRFIPGALHCVAPRRVALVAFANVSKTRDLVAERVGFEPRDIDTPATKAETFHWTSPAKEACVVETEKQIDPCSEHDKRPASAPGLWWCKCPIAGIESGGR